MTPMTGGGGETWGTEKARLNDEIAALRRELDVTTDDLMHAQELLEQVKAMSAADGVKMRELQTELEQVKAERDAFHEVLALATGTATYKCTPEYLEGWIEDDEHWNDKLEHTQAQLRTAREALEVAWGVIANAGGGNWENESPEWAEAAARWRDEHFHPLMSDHEPKHLEGEGL